MTEETRTCHTPSSQEQGEIPQAISISVLVSHESSGSNFRAIVKAIEEKRLIGIRVALVLSDGPDAPSFQFAREHNIFCGGLPKSGKKDSPERDDYSRNLAVRLNQNGVKIAVLAGFGKLLTGSYLDEFDGVTVNIHPGAIPFAKDRPYFTPDGKESPWNQGKMTDDAVDTFIKQGLKFAVSTVHVVTGEADFGPVLERGMEEIMPGDTVSSLYSRLKVKEHEALIRALQNPRRIFEKTGKSFPTSSSIFPQ